MKEQEISHIEIIVKEEEPAPVSEKNALLKKLIDLEGWKRDLKRLRYFWLALAIVVGGYFVAKIFFVGRLGVRLQSPISFVAYEKYSHQNPDFSFSYPKGFSFDGDEKKKYGADYLAGFYLNADQRTGCDVRTSSVGINFAKSDAEINAAIEKDLTVNVKGFADFQGRRVKIDGQNGMDIEFSLIDPLGNTLHIHQVMTSNAGANYLLACGSGKAQYKFFQKDFADFFDSFRWE